MKDFAVTRASGKSTENTPRSYRPGPMFGAAFHEVDESARWREASPMQQAFAKGLSQN